MKKYELDGRICLDKEDFCLRLISLLNFPDYCGHNLDALHDCLTDLTDTQLVIEDCALAADHLEAWPGFLQVFFDSAAQNRGLSIRLLPGNGDYGK